LLLPTKFTSGDFTLQAKDFDTYTTCAANFTPATAFTYVKGQATATITMLDAFKCGVADEPKNEIWETCYMEIMGAFVFVLFILFVTGKKT